MLTTSIISDIFTFRQALIDNLSTLARAIGTHAAPAIAQWDSEVASRLLVTFSAEQSLLGALIVLRDGHVFAEYSLGLNPNQGGPRFPPSLWEELDDTRVTFHLHYIEILTPIQNRNETIAAVVLQASPASLYERLFWKLLATVIQLSAAIVLALLVSTRIKRQIAQPITDLAGAMNQVSHEKNYDILVQKREDDEIGALIDGFNQMLAQIRQRDEQLESLATRDTMTGCLNRRAFFEAFKKEFDSAYAQAHSLSCIMTDIDHFKSINDRYGHQVGDQAIQIVAKTLSSQLRPHDLLCRYGGEEFCIILPELTSEAAAAVAERLRSAIQTSAGRGLRGPEDITITSSFGVAALHSGVLSHEALIDQADQALYVSKRNGRNRVTQYTETEQD